MKKIILITGLILSANLWASPMDTICSFEGQSGGGFGGYVKLEKNCERNNILEVKGIILSDVTFVVNGYCRFDRNVYVQERKGEKERGKEIYDLGCVLYDSKIRGKKSYW